ncbi:envelope stress response membrane protein PspC [Paraglaciecola aquimarina]|uniref:Envelope stress response membrane protein PspC n=1 Tax=Paraglaciecola aquimarina TaxID=1235557 RepID=A0ABU3T017_9ALTE|nr:envelope stress response membrane protein PspC [Paraglaciecola aquimarina]MDU0355605.1 envelope stress response membrane protein PspC [Paraglaciecola aquimarina]
MSLRKTLYRDPSKGKIAGVCAGIAEYFGMESWLVRILMVSGFFLLAAPFIFFAYIAAWFILEKKPGHLAHQSHQQVFGNKETVNKQAGKGWHNVPDDEVEKVVVKSKVWQAGELPSQALFDIKQRFDSNENRLRKVETYVTSSEYQLNREINQL